MTRPTNLPQTAEYRAVRENNWPLSERVEIDSFYMVAWRTDIRLMSKSEGYQLAGSAMAWVSAGYGVIYDLQGSTHGQWFKAKEEALARYNSLKIQNQTR